MMAATRLRVSGFMLAIYAAGDLLLKNSTVLNIPRFLLANVTYCLLSYLSFSFFLYLIPQSGSPF